MATPKIPMSSEEKAAKTAAFFSGASAVASTVAAFKASASSQGVSFPPQVLDLLQHISDGMDLSVADLQDIINALATMTTGNSQGYPPNADYVTTSIVTCTAANKSYEVPSLVVPDNFHVFVKAHPGNAVGSYIYVATSPATNPNTSHPLVPNEPLTLKIKDAGKLYVWSNIAGSQAVITVEQRAGA